LARAGGDGFFYCLSHPVPNRAEASIAALAGDYRRGPDDELLLTVPASDHPPLRSR